MKLLEDFPARLIYSVIGLVILGFLGSAIGSVGIYLLRPIDSLGQLMAWLCIYRGSCDFNTNLVSLAVAFYVTLGIFVLFVLTVMPLLRDTADEDEEAEKAVEDTTGETMYDHILNAVKHASPTGILPIEISRKTGHNIQDVHRTLGYLYDDGEVLTTRADGRSIRYVLYETEEEKVARIALEEVNKARLAAFKKDPRTIIYLLPRRWLVLLGVLMVLSLAVGVYGVTEMFAR